MNVISIHNWFFSTSLFFIPAEIDPVAILSGASMGCKFIWALRKMPIF